MAQANMCNEVTFTCVQVFVASVKGEPLSGVVVYLEPLKNQSLN